MGFLIISFNFSAVRGAETSEIKTTNQAESVSSRTIMYSIRPLALIGSEVVGNNAQHLTLLPPGVTPHDYVLKISDISRLKQADVIVWMGPDIEPYLLKVISRLSKNQKRPIVINVSDVNQVPGIKLLTIKETIDHEHHQGHESLESVPANYDPHLWLSPTNAMAIAGTIIKKITLIDPGSKKEMEFSLRVFKEEMALINSHNGPISHKPYVVYHNAFAYLERYLKIQNSGAITDNHHSKAGLRHIVDMAEKINLENITCMISPLNFDEKLVEKVFGKNQFSVSRLDLMADLSNEGAHYSEYLKSFIQELKTCVEYKKSF